MENSGRFFRLSPKTFRSGLGRLQDPAENCGSRIFFTAHESPLSANSYHVILITRRCTTAD
jgi:hypothetical protein